MAIIRPQNSSLLQFLYTHDTSQRHHLPTPTPPPPPPKVFHYYTPKHFLRITRTTPSVFSCNSMFQNCTASIQSKHNSSQTSIIRHGLVVNEPVIDSLAKKEPVIDVSLVNEMIKEYTDDGFFEDAIRVYVNLLHFGVAFENFRFFPCLIKAFGGLCDVEKGRQIHGHVLKLGVFCEIYIANSLLGMYWKCGAVEDAVRMFEKMGRRDMVSWNTMVSGLEQSVDYEGSLVLFSRMIWEFGIYPNRVACVSALSSSASLQSLIHGREIHAFAVKCGLDVDDFLISGLIEMYMKCGKVGCAEHVFQTIINKEASRGNTVIWNVMITGYVSNGCLSQALALFVEMLVLGVKLDSSTVVSILVWCSQRLNLAIGRQIHGFSFRLGLLSDVRVETALLDMYFKCGDIPGGLNIFRKSQNRNLVMWGAAISNCAQSGSFTSALELFHNFCLEYGSPDSAILLAVLRACSSLTLKPKGVQVHALAVKMGSDSNVFIGGALVDMYAKCKDIESAEKAFSRLTKRDLISWNALISGYAQNDCADQALKAFRHMQSEYVRPNTVTAASILSVCSHLSVNIQCKEIHNFLIRRGYEPNVLVSNSLISTYAKCGDIKSSWTIFEQMPEKNEVSWNSILLGFGMHGNIDEMFILFDKMKAAGVKPDHVTFTAILSACSHAGRVDKGWECFNNMIEEYKLEPQLEQYACMVDLLGRAGQLNQAYDLIMTMPLTPDVRIWGSLLGSCKSYSDEKLARVVANHIFKLDPSSIGYRVLLANLYEELGEWDEVNRVRSEIKDMGLRKRPGCSWIEVNNNTHIFIAGDKSHHQSVDIYATIENLTTEIKREGYNRLYTLSDSGA